jgi:hypothetical protein
MIKLIYNDGCRLGNRLYMYAAGRLLAQKLGARLQSEPLEGFPRTRDILTGYPVAVAHINLSGADPIPSWPDLTNVPKQVDVDIEHGWVNSRYFVADRDLIRSWFWSQPPIEVDPDDVLVNVRLREFTPLGLTLDPSYYTTVLERMQFKKLYLMTDNPSDPFLGFLAKYNPIPVTGYGPEHFFKALAFKRIVMSNSTFCWWFTFVSEATEIYLPMLNGYRCGSWCLDHLPAIDLRLDWPEVTHVYNIPCWGPNPLPGPTNVQRAEALAFGKKSKTMFLGD